MLKSLSLAFLNCGIQALSLTDQVNFISLAQIESKQDEADRCDYEHGVLVHYYQVPCDGSPDFSDLDAFKADIVDAIDYDGNSAYVLTSGLQTGVGASFEGLVDIPEDGEWKFGVVSEDKAKLWVDDRLLLDLDEEFSAKEISAGFHKVVVEYYQLEGNQAVQVWAGGPGMEYQVIPADMWYLTYKAGVKVSVFDGEWESLPNFDKLKSSETLVFDQIEYESDDSDSMGVVANGYVLLREAEELEFILISDDGSKLWLDDELLIDNDGIMTEALGKVGKAQLAAGMHKVRVEYFAQSGSSYIKLLVGNQDGFDYGEWWHYYKDQKKRIEMVVVDPCEGKDLHARLVESNDRVNQEVDSNWIIDNCFDPSRIDEQGRYGLTPLAAATLFQYFTTMEKLLKLGANPDIPFTLRSTYTPLFYAVKQKNQKGANMLLDYNAKVDLTDAEGYSELFWAIYYKLESTVPALLDNGADCQLKSKTHDWRTPLIQASFMQLTNIVEILLEKGCDTEVIDHTTETSLIKVAFLGNRQIIHNLLEKGADINAQDSNGETALITAANMNKLDSAKELIKYNPDFEVQKKGGETAMHKAAQQGFTDMVKLLVEAGADMDTSTEYGDTALMFAIENYHYECAQYLIDTGANLNLVQQYRGTALHLAADHNDEQAVKMLLDAGARTDIPNKDDHLAIHVTDEDDIKEMIQAASTA